MALLEASCSELPIVATDAGGNREIVQQATTGFLVPTQNSPALAAQMHQLMQMPEEERRRMGRIGREFCASRFSVGQIVQQWMQLFAECLKSEHSTAPAKLASSQPEL